MGTYIDYVYVLVKSQIYETYTGCPKKKGTRINQLCMHLKRNLHKLMLYAL